MELACGSQEAPTVQTHPLPRVEPAFDFAALLVEFDASFAPAFERADLDGLPPFPIDLLLSLLCAEL